MLRCFLYLVFFGHLKCRHERGISSNCFLFVCSSFVDLFGPHPVLGATAHTITYLIENYSYPLLEGIYIVSFLILKEETGVDSVEQTRLEGRSST